MHWIRTIPECRASVYTPLRSATNANRRSCKCALPAPSLLLSLGLRPPALPALPAPLAPPLSSHPSGFLCGQVDKVLRKKSRSPGGRRIPAAAAKERDNFFYADGWVHGMPCRGVGLTGGCMACPVQGCEGVPRRLGRVQFGLQARLTAALAACCWQRMHGPRRTGLPRQRACTCSVCARSSCPGPILPAGSTPLTVATRRWQNCCPAC